VADLPAQGQGQLRGVDGARRRARWSVEMPAACTLIRRTIIRVPAGQPAGASSTAATCAPGSPFALRHAALGIEAIAARTAGLRTAAIATSAPAVTAA
jgi:hypothetical protein